MIQKTKVSYRWVMIIELLIIFTMNLSVVVFHFSREAKSSRDRERVITRSKINNEITLSI